MTTQKWKLEPVAWMVKNGFICSMIYQSKKDAENYAAAQQKRHDLSGSLASFCVVPLYTTPQPPKLSDARIEELIEEYQPGCKHSFTIGFARAIEREILGENK